MILPSKVLNKYRHTHANQILSSFRRMCNLILIKILMLSYYLLSVNILSSQGLFRANCY